MTLEAADAIAKFMFAGKDVNALAAAGRSFNGLEVKAEDLRKCKAPALSIYGSKDSESTKARIAVLREGTLKAEIKVIEGADHVTTLTNPEFASTIVAFLLAHKSK